MDMKYLLLITIFLAACSTPKQEQYPIGEKITFSFAGPEMSEEGSENPFTDVRLAVTFSHDSTMLTVPGFFAADGTASSSGSAKGNTWQVRFRPEFAGDWTYTVQFVKGKGVALQPDVRGEPLAGDGEKTSFTVLPGDYEGRLTTSGRYRIYSQSGRIFLKGGTDSPENFLAYYGFDNTYRDGSQSRRGEASVDTTLHNYAPHLRDWKTWDPTWNDQGREIIGAVNYLASKGINSVYMLLMNINGDGKDVWPYVTPNDFTRFDCSKLDQWEVLFDHMDQLGIHQHFVLQETENELLLDDGNMGTSRQLYLREMIARFGHHPGVTWNIGEENGPADFSPDGMTTSQQKAMISYINETDPYDNLIVVHTHAAQRYREALMTPLLGFPDLDGPSLQIDNPADVYSETQFWIRKSAETEHQWIVNMDEIGPYWAGIHPDDFPGNNQDTLFRDVLWGHLLAGGAGIEWYFGYKAPHNDLNSEDWRARERVWSTTVHAINFLSQFPLQTMSPRPEIVESGNARPFGNEDVLIVFVNDGESPSIRLPDASFTLNWVDPLGIKDERPGSGSESGPTRLTPPTSGDWLAVLRTGT